MPDDKTLQYKVAIEDIIVTYEQLAAHQKQDVPYSLYAAIMKAKSIIESK